MKDDEPLPSWVRIEEPGHPGTWIFGIALGRAVMIKGDQVDVELLTGEIIPVNREWIRLGWPTLIANEAKNAGGAARYDRNSYPLNAFVAGQIPAHFAEWLMGFPDGWTEIESTAVQKEFW